jgi:ribosomal protein S27E
MVELRCPDCKRVWQYDGNSKFYTHCPQCEKVVGSPGPGIMEEIIPRSESLKGTLENF